MAHLKKITSYLPARQWSILLTTFAIALWAYSLIQTKLTLDGYGLIHSYPLSFFVALGVLTIASAILWVSDENHNLLLFLQLFFFITALWLTPLLIGGIGNSQPNFTTSFSEYGLADYIIRNGHFSSEIFWRLSFPGVYIITAIIMKILALNNPSIFIAILPYIWQFIILLPLYLIFKNILRGERRNYIWAGLWIVFAGGWSEVASLHTQYLSNFLVLTLLAIITNALIQKGIVGSLGSGLVSVLIIACQTITHLMTSIFVMVMLVFLALQKKFRVINFVLIAGAFCIVWLLFIVPSFFEGQLPTFITRVFRFDLFFSASVAERIAGNAAHQFVVQIRLLITILFGIIALIGLIIGRKNKNNSDAIMLSVGLSAIILAIVIGAGYGFEAPQRFFFFLMPPFAYFTIKLLRRRATTFILIALLIIVLPLYIVSRYGNQAMDYASSSMMSSWEFFSQKTTHGSVISNGPFGEITNIEKYSTLSLAELVGEADPLSKLPKDYPQYICLSEQNKVYFNIIFNNPRYILEFQEALDIAKNYNLIFINPDSSIYINEGR
jgi:hypothetical protein